MKPKSPIPSVEFTAHQVEVLAANAELHSALIALDESAAIHAAADERVARAYGQIRYLARKDVQS